MFRVFGVPPTSEYTQFKENDPSYKPSPEELSAKLFFNSRKEGYVLFSDGTLSQLLLSASSIPFLNKIINGDFSVKQISTVAGGIISSGYYTADRWFFDVNTGTFLQQVVTPTAQFYSLHTEVVAAVNPTGTDIISPFEQFIEPNDIIDLLQDGGPITISFLLQSNISPLDFSLALQINEPPNIHSYVKLLRYDHPSLGFQQFNVVIDSLPSVQPPFHSPWGMRLCIGALGGGAYKTSAPDTWITGNYRVHPSAFNWASSVGNFLRLAKVRLISGITSPDKIVNPPFSLELLRCMRFYEKSYNYGSYAGSSVQDGSYRQSLPVSGTGLHIVHVDFKVPKRAVPWIGIYDPVTGAYNTMRVDGNQVTPTLENIGEKGFDIYWNNTTLSKSSIHFHWVAVAEIYP